MNTYNSELLNKPFHIVLTKSDMVDEDEKNEKIKQFEKNSIAISSVSGENLHELLRILDKLLGM